MLPDAISLRPGTPADAVALAALAARTFAETFGPDNRPEDIAAHLAEQYGEAQQAKELHDPAYVTIVAELAGSLVAFAQVRRNPPPPCVTEPAPVELYRFYVDRPFHGRGLAAPLMEAVYDAARTMGGRSVWLGVWERNPRAIAFYGKAGYRDAGVTDYWVGPDRQTDRVMVKRLAVSGEL